MAPSRILAAKLKDALTGRAAPGFASSTMWSAMGIAISTISMLAANLAAVATSSPAAFADFAVATAVLFLVGTAARLGANQLIIAEIHDVSQRDGETAGRRRGADIVAFVVLTGIAGGLALGIPPVRHVLQLGLSTPLSDGDVAALGVWLAADVVRLVVSEAHRARYQFRLAALAGQGARAPLFLVLVPVFALLEGGGLGRGGLFWAAAISSGVVCLVTLGTASVWFPWWKSNPLRSARILWRGHVSMLLTTLAAALIGNADLWILGSSASAATTASYGLAVTLVAGIGVLGVALTSGLAPFLASASAGSSLGAIQRRVVRYVRGASVLAVAALGLLILGAGPMARALGGDGYGHITEFVAILGLGQLVGVLAGVGGSVLIAARRYRAMAVVAVAVALTAVALESAAAWWIHSPILVAGASGLATAALHAISSFVLFRLMAIRTDAFAAAHPEGS